MLEAELPYRPRAVSLARYNDDHRAGGDLPRLSGEIDAFAYLLASRQLRPPLAVGLFGDWGSGKTFFMQSVRRRIEEIMADPAVAGVTQADTEFWRHIVQIDFNAWQYSESDLLASLINHLFTQLERETAPPAATGRSGSTRAEQESWIRQLTAVTEAEEASRREVDRLTGEVEGARQEARTAEIEAQDRIDGADEAVLRATRTAVEEAIVAVIEEAAIGDRATVADLERQLLMTKREISRTRGFVAVFTGRSWRTALSIAAVALIPVIVVLVERAVGWAESALAGLTAVAVEALAAWTAATAWLVDRNDQIEKARAEVLARQRAVEAEATERLADKQRALADKEAELARAERAVTAAVAERQAIEQRLHEPVSQSIQRFIRERLDSGTYRQRLGLHAIVHEDLGRLSTFIDQQNTALVEGSRADEPERMFNRIVLYIDDLDRCPDETVIKVLQAVHLLLSFELFVVVVAVDDRWLSHALETHYPVLAGESNGDVGPDVLGPSDYLEKIFQVPFRVSPIGPEGRRRMVGGLMRQQVSAPTGGGDDDRHARARLIGERERRVIESTVTDQSRDVSTATEQLTLSRAEFETLDHLAPLLGDTPRSVKRFVNVYQLLKMMDVTPTGVDPADHEVAAVLLGLDEGRPDLAHRVRGLGPLSVGTIAELADLCAAQPRWATVTGDRFEEVDDLVGRFQFP